MEMVYIDRWLDMLVYVLKWITCYILISMTI